MTKNGSIVLAVLAVMVILLLCKDYNEMKREEMRRRLAKKMKSRCAAINEVEPFEDKDESYNDYLMSAGLEKTVVDSHKRFVKEMSQNTSGASTQTTVSHSVNINPWVGLRRPETLQVNVDPNAREVPTELPQQLTLDSKPRKWYF